MSLRSVAPGAVPAAPAAASASSATLVVWLLWLLVGAAMRTSIASLPPLIGEIQAALGIGAQAAALLTTLPVVLMGVLPFAVSAAAGRRDWVPLVAAALVVLALATALRLAVHGYAALLATCFATGCAIAVCQTLIPAATSGYARPAALMSVYTAGMGLGASAAAAASPWLAARTGAWQDALAAWGLVPLLAAALLLLGVRRSAAAVRRPPAVIRTHWLPLLCVAVFAAGSSTLFWALLTWLAPAYREAGYSATEAGALMAAFTLAQIPGSLAAGACWSRWQFRVPAVLLVLTAASVAAIPYLPQPTWAWLLVSVAGFGCGGVFSLAMFMPSHLSRDTGEIRRITAFALSAAYLVASLGPLAFAALREGSGSWHPAFLALAALCLPMALAMGRIRLDGQRRAAAAAAPAPAP